MGTINEIWHKRSIIYNYAISDLKNRYTNSILGFFWTFLEPLLMLSVLYIVFTNLFKSQIENFPLYILLGIILWNMFSRGTGTGLGSILSRGGVLTQIYFPREIPSISASLTSFLMLCFELIVFGIFMAAFRFVPPITIIFLPFVLLIEFILVLGISLPLSVLNVKFRDVQFIWTVILQAGFFLTPIFYKSDILPQKFQEILYFSPMVQIVEMAHSVVLFGRFPSIESIVVAVGVTGVVFGICYAIFRKKQVRIMEEL